MKVLIIRFSSLGDCILLCPLATYLKTSGAEQVTVVTKRAYAEVFAAATGVDRVVAFDPGGGLRGLLRIATEAVAGRSWTPITTGGVGSSPGGWAARRGVLPSTTANGWG